MKYLKYIQNKSQLLRVVKFKQSDTPETGRRINRSQSLKFSLIPGYQDIIQNKQIQLKNGR